MSADAFERLDERSRLVLARAAQVARTMEEPVVEQRHVVIALLLSGDAAIVRALEAVRGSRPPLTSEILRLAPRYLWYSSERAMTELGYRPGSVDAGILAALDEVRARIV